jgi:hypothetical protein
MIHFTCDGCKRELESGELRYSVSIEVSTALDPPADDEVEDDRDHLREVDEILAGLEDAVLDDDVQDAPLERQYDLCPKCARRFLRNPLNREPSKQFDFSPN